MEDKDFIRGHYEALMLVGYVVLIAAVIFFLAVPRIVQFCMVVVAVLFFLPMLRARASSSEPPCGGDLNGEGIARPRPGFKP